MRDLQQQCRFRNCYKQTEVMAANVYELLILRLRSIPLC